MVRTLVHSQYYVHSRRTGASPRVWLDTEREIEQNALSYSRRYVHRMLLLRERYLSTLADGCTTTVQYSILPSKAG